MKKLITNLILVAVFMLFPVSVFASGNISASPSSLSIEVGSSKTFTITATNTIGDVSISSSNTGVAMVSTGEWGTGMVDEGQTKSGSITVTGVSVGTATITLTLDAATFDGEDLAGQKRTVTVTVVAKPTQPSNNNNNNNNNNSNNNNNTNNNNTNNTANNKSTNNKIKELTIDGYELKKVDDHNYTLSVGNDVNSINIKTTAEDSKAKVTGSGSHELKVGENNIEITVTAENGSQNKISIKVTRKDAYYLEDLDSVLNSSTANDIIINSDSKLSSQDLSKIKNSKKTIRFNYNDENKKTLYSWSIDGSKMNDFDELITGIDFKSNNSKEISKLSNYADGLYISMKHNGGLPSGTKIKIYVGDKYSDGDIVNAYYYNSNNNKLENVKEGLTVKDGYVEFEVEKGSDYFITMSTISNSDKVVSTTGKSSSPILLVIIGILSLSVIGLIIAFILKNKKNKKDDDNNNDSGNSSVTDDYETLTPESNSVDTTNSSQDINKSYNSYNSNQQVNTTSNINYNNSSNYNN